MTQLIKYISFDSVLEVVLDDEKYGYGIEVKIDPSFNHRYNMAALEWSIVQEELQKLINK